METVTKSSVLPLKRTAEQISLSKAEVEKQLEEFISIQKSFNERLENLEKDYAEEIKKIHDIFKNLGKELDKFKNHVNKSIQDQIGYNLTDLTRIQNEQAQRIDQFEQTISTIETNSAEESIQEIRQELINGIRMLGERMSKAIDDMNKRFKDIQVSADEQKRDENIEESKAKDGAQLDSDNFEIIPKGAVVRLAQLFKKQSNGIKKFVEDQQARISGFETLLNTYDEKNDKLIEMMNQKSKRNLVIYFIGIGVLAVLMIVFQFVNN